MAFPDFLGIGAQRSGTSWLHKNLSQHPDVWLPFTKELHYFDERIKEPKIGAPLLRLLTRGTRPDDWYPWVWRYQLRARLRRHRHKFDVKAARWDLRYFGRSPSDRWYAALFEQGSELITGEITPEYALLGERDVAHVHALMPNAKIILLLRNPIERCYSGALWRIHLLLARKLIRGQQRFEDVIDEHISENMDHLAVRAQTNYLKTLDTWRRFYPDEHIFIGFFEDIHFHPGSMLRRLYDFLGADPSKAQKPTKSRVNPRSPEWMPTWAAVHLAHAYHEDLQRLSARFGGYASFWLYCAQRLASEHLYEETLRFPLWNSWLWEDWIRESRSFTPVDSRTGKVQSKSLA